MNRPLSKNTNQKERKSVKYTKDIKGMLPRAHIQSNINCRKLGKKKTSLSSAKEGQHWWFPMLKCTFWSLMSNNPGVSKCTKER